MRPVLFYIGDIAIPSFWAMAFLGFFVGLLVIRRDIVERGYDVRLAYDLVLWAYVGGWIGARLFVIPTGWNYFVEDPIALPALVERLGLVRRRRSAAPSACCGGRARVGIPARRRRRHHGAGAGHRPGDRPHRLSARRRRRLRRAHRSAVGHELPGRRRADDRARAPDADLRDGAVHGDLRRRSGANAAAACRRALCSAQYLVYSGRRASRSSSCAATRRGSLGLTTAQWFSLASIALGGVSDAAVRAEAFTR